MTTHSLSTCEVIPGNSDVKRLLRDLNNEYRDTQEALNHAQASLTRAMRIAEQNYQRKRQQILNGNGDDRNEL
jgi:hypothetical protein